ncbi:MAG: hypothetical protein LKE53_01415 [Oscillospiraceae bacterium]|jgi:hypothetical protein|nr:hypothetical protein [Oscillospiraceae bacterium]MDD3260776.1 hypothetical protein [Oscillospiraceae bacterium]
MAAKRYQNAEFVVLQTFMTPDHFRTVFPQMLSIPCGLGEIPVELDLSADYIRTLPSGLSDDGITVYGFVRPNAALRARFGDALKSRRAKCSITFSDWDSRFLFLCETGEESIPAFVKKEEVTELLKNCLHASR